MQYIRQDLVEQIKQEVLAELHNHYPQSRSERIMPVDPNLAMKQTLKQELLAELEAEASSRQSAPYYRPTTNSESYQDIANNFIEESRRSTLQNPTSASSPKSTPIFSGPRVSGQFRGLLYGLGAVALGALVLPSVSNKFRSVVSRTVADSSDLIDRAKSVVVRAREGVEDIVAEASFKRFQAKILEGDNDNPQN